MEWRNGSWFFTIWSEVKWSRPHHNERTCVKLPPAGWLASWRRRQAAARDVFGRSECVPGENSSTCSNKGVGSRRCGGADVRCAQTWTWARTSFHAISPLRLSCLTFFFSRGSHQRAFDYSRGAFAEMGRRARWSRVGRARARSRCGRRELLLRKPVAS